MPEKSNSKRGAWKHILNENDTDFQKAFEGLRNSKEKFITELKKRIEGILGHTGTITRREELLKRANTIYFPPQKEGSVCPRYYTVTEKKYPIFELIAYGRL